MTGPPQPLPATSTSQQGEATPSASSGIRFGSGFYDAEQDEDGEFRWLSRRGQLILEPSSQSRFLELQVRSEFSDLSQELQLSAGNASTSVVLVHGWVPLSLAIPAGTTTVELAVNKLFPPPCYPGDRRQLALRVRRGLLHKGERRHRAVCRHLDNNILNLRETLEGREVLRSRPVNLGIDPHGVCNVNPPCVYCEYEQAKQTEGERARTPFTVDTLRGYGDFFSSASRLLSCSFGEPFMMRNLDELLDLIEAEGLTLEMSTNGQILTESNVASLVDHSVELYVSVDAATATTYARLRNDTFDRVVDNIARLVAAKGGPGFLPRVSLVFMPMRVNRHEAVDFVRLCHRLRVDQLILRPLNRISASRPSWQRGGYTFRYDDEVLPLEELIRLSGRLDELCRRLAVPLSNQLDFGGATQQLFDELYAAGKAEVNNDLADTTATAAQHQEAVVAVAENRDGTDTPGQDPAAAPDNSQAEPEPDQDQPPSLGEDRLPLCTEPWHSFYLLRRGSLPCCYGGPLPAGNSIAEEWNGELLQGIRSALARGSFHRYCLHTPSCPIVAKHHQAGLMDSADAGKLVAYRLLFRFDHLTERWPWKLLAPLRGFLVQVGRVIFGSSRTASNNE